MKGGLWGWDVGRRGAEKEGEPNFTQLVAEKDSGGTSREQQRQLCEKCTFSFSHAGKTSIICSMEILDKRIVYVNRNIGTKDLNREQNDHHKCFHFFSRLIEFSTYVIVVKAMLKRKQNRQVFIHKDGTRDRPHGIWAGSCSLACGEMRGPSHPGAHRVTST